MKRTCVRSPDRFQITNMFTPGYRFLKGDNPTEAPQGPGRETSDLATVPIAVLDALGVRIARSGLGQTATDEVGTGDDRDVEPCLAGDELVGPVGIAALDHGGADENRDNHADHPPELSGLERLLGLRRQAANPALATDGIGAHGTGLRCCFHAFYFSCLGCPAWAVQADRVGHACPFAPRSDGQVAFALSEASCLA